MRVPGIHGSKRKTYPSTIGTSGSSAIGFPAIRRRATSTREAAMASVLVYHRTGLPIAALTCNFPSGVANGEERRKPRSMIGQLHHGEPQMLGMAAVILFAASIGHVHTPCQASQGFTVTATIS